MDYLFIFCFSLLFAIIGYLIGSILLGPIFSKIKNIDLRSSGSKNVGSTNVTRVMGIKMGMLTYLWDSVKSWISIFLALLIFVGSKNIYSDLDFYSTNGFVIYIAGFFTIVGHCFPIQYLIKLIKNNFNFEYCQNFKGGKGAASTAGFFMAISPWIFIICFLFFWIMLLITKYVSVSSILSIILGFIMTLIPNLNFLYMLNLNSNIAILENIGDSINNFHNPIINFHNHSQYIYFVSTISLVITIIVIYKHKDNIVRLINKNESKVNLIKR